MPSDEDSHCIGALKFGPDGMLYIASGDGASYWTVDSLALAGAEHRPLQRQDPAREPGERPGTVGQPVLRTATLNATRSKVWAYGVRNDFRFNFKPGTNAVHAATSAGTRGRRST